MPTQTARFTGQVVSLSKKAVGGEPDPAVRKGDGGYADWVIIALHGLREYLGHTYRMLIDVLREMPGIVRKLELSVEELPDFTTVSHAKERLEMRIWRVLLRLSAQLHDTGEIQAIDATGFDRDAASRKYAKRTNYSFQALKVTVLVDCDTGTILDVHCSTKQPHDTQIGWQVLTRNLEDLSTITADKGYDWGDLRAHLRDNDVRPMIKHREFTSLDLAHNARLDEDVYNRRSVSECVIRVLKQRYGDRIRAATWYAQFRELVCKCAVKNIEASIKPSPA